MVIPEKCFSVLYLVNSLYSYFTNIDKYLFNLSWSFFSWILRANFKALKRKGPANYHPRHSMKKSRTSPYDFTWSDIFWVSGKIGTTVVSLLWISEHAGREKTSRRSFSSSTQHGAARAPYWVMFGKDVLESTFSIIDKQGPAETFQCQKWK